jgi:hypothetical protein
MTSAAPVRIQLSRRKGFNLQVHSRSINGLEAVNCARPGKWGNPFIEEYNGAEFAVSTFRAMLMRETPPCGFRPRINDMQKELKGKNLACWCAPDEPCHADVLLELANTL